MPLLDVLLPKLIDEANKRKQQEIEQHYKELTGNDPAVNGENLVMSGDDIAGGMVSSFPLGAAKSIADGTLGKVADTLEQSAVGIKKHTPGLGRILTKMGIRGTNAGMLKKVGNKIGTEGAKLQSAVESIPGMIEPNIPAGSVSSLADKLTTSTGRVTEMAQPMVDSIKKTVADITSRGGVSPTEALELKRIAQKMGYSLKSGEPMSKLASQVAQKEAFGYGDALAGAYADRVGGENIVKSGNEALSALLNAQRGLNKGTKPAFNIIDSVISKSVNTPLVKSYGAKALDMGAEALGGIGSVGEKMLTMPDMQSETWNDEDERELNELKDAVRMLSNEQSVK